MSSASCGRWLLKTSIPEEYIPKKQDSEVDRHSPLYTICTFSSAPNLLHQASPLGWGMQDFLGSNSKSEVAHVPSCPFRLQIHSYFDDSHVFGRFTMLPRFATDVDGAGITYWKDSR